MSNLECHVWNEFNFKKPPMLTVLSKKTKFVRRLRAEIKACLDWDSKHTMVFRETAALLSRLMARRKNSFRRMAGYRYLLKINVALCRLLRVDLTRDVECFCGALPDAHLCDGVSNAELPTRNMLDFVLIRLVGAHHIYQRIREYCTKAADHFTSLLRTNFFLEINTLLLAVLAKLYRFSGEAGNNYNNLYSCMLARRNKFPYHGQGVPDEIQFPMELETFCKSKHISEVATDVDSAATMLRLVPSECPNMIPVVKKMQQMEDLGVAIGRPNKQLSPIAIQQLTTIKDMQTFISNESELRKKCLKNCITKRIVGHEWMGAVKHFKSKVEAREHTKALNVFKMFLHTKI